MGKQNAWTIYIAVLKNDNFPLWIGNVDSVTEGL